MFGVGIIVHINDQNFFPESVPFHLDLYRINGTYDFLEHYNGNWVIVLSPYHFPRLDLPRASLLIGNLALSLRNRNPPLNASVFAVFAGSRGLLVVRLHFDSGFGGFD